MGDQETSFEAVVVAGVAGVLGVAYVLGAMLALLSDSSTGVLLLTGSIPVTTVVGVLLALVAGLLSTGQRHGRHLGVLAFGAVVVFGRPSLAAPELVDAVQAGVGLVVALYLTFRNPIPKPERSQIDESTSATKMGSTIR